MKKERRENEIMGDVIVLVSRVLGRGLLLAYSSSSLKVNDEIGPRAYPTEGEMELNANRTKGI